MTRDMELIRKIIGEIQSWSEVRMRPVVIQGYEPQVVARHLEILIKSGLADGLTHRDNEETIVAFVRDLTWEGHDFAGAIQNDNVWAKLKEKLSPTELATLPMAVLKRGAIAVFERYVLGKLDM